MIGKLLIVWYYLLTKYRMRFSSRERLERWQEKRIRRHLRFVRSRSAFYRELWGELPDSEWRRFPIIGKPEMMEHFNRLNTAGIDRDVAFALALKAEASRDFTPTIGSITIGMSSGTSGSRGLFLVSARERMAWAGTVLAKVLPRSLLHRERIAFFLRADSNLYGSVGSRRLQFRFYDLLDPLAEHVDRLNRQQPTILAAPPSLLRVLAEAVESGRLDIQPHRILSVAEVLDPLDCERIEAAFKQKVHQIYQCTEGFLAVTCPHGTLHLNEDIVAVEKDYLDASLRKFVPIITDFSRTTQPIIRYRLNDILTERAEPCPCGSPHLALERVEGRSDDLFYLYGLTDGGLVPVFPDFISRAIISASEDVEEYKAVQHAPDALEISLRLKQGKEGSMDPVQQSILNSLDRLWARAGCSAPSVQFSLLNWTPGVQKLRRVERRFSPMTGKGEMTIESTTVYAGSGK
ncbi:putative adenylate-forming enzyme [Paenibacillus sp. OAS669]|nr:F390 synthetase-related protein [Paenibacillus sp. OAS669]MBE1444773.1 putative adenylate-forming enzyme [Paenibacillus sp. OAS669]